MKHARGVRDSDTKWSRFRYVPVHPESQRWGAYLTSAGFTSVAPGAPYPPALHPSGHHFTWAHGRVLTAHQLLCLTRGRGTFESKPAGRLAVEAGDLLVLHPGVWHRYRPDPQTGWDEYWVELGGEQVLRALTPALLDVARPVHRVGHHEALLASYLEAIDWLRGEPPDSHLLLSVQALRIVALVRSALKARRLEGRPVADIIREARDLLTRGAGRSLRLESLAAQLGISYSQFRRLFKAHTGFAPLHYALQETHRRACELLVNTQRPIGQIASDLGYDSIFYFSRQFKLMAGLSPLAYRRARGRGADASHPAL